MVTHWQCAINTGGQYKQISGTIAPNLRLIFFCVCTETNLSTEYS